MKPGGVDLIRSGNGAFGPLCLGDFVVFLLCESVKGRWDHEGTETQRTMKKMNSAFLANCGKVYMRHPDPRVYLIGTQDEVLMMSDDSITMTLSRQEALVLFDWIASLDEGNASSICDDAQQQVVWAVEGRLEKVLTEVLAPDYNNIISNAKRYVLGQVE